MSFPAHWGAAFTAKQHNLAQGPTEPENNKQPSAGTFVVVVTGAGKGIGYFISLAYARAGATGIVIASRTQSDLDRLSSELKSINPRLDVLSIICDATVATEVEILAKATELRFSGHVDVVVANAGIVSRYIEDDSAGGTRRMPIGILEDDDFTRVTNTNYIGTYHTARYFTPLLTSSNNPSKIKAFVAITSIASMMSDTQWCPVAYNISKLAINRMIEHMANDYGKEGLLTFSVHPGEVLTPQTERHSVTKGDRWEQTLTTDLGLCGGFLTWLTREPRNWLSGRYLSVHWDVDELVQKKDEILKDDKLKFRMVV